jgi:outer membrane protein assembly factor BamD (BamD/ComL family)
MKTRAILIIVILSACAFSHLDIHATKTTKTEKKKSRAGVKKNQRRKKAREERKAQEERRKKAPKQRFQVEPDRSVHFTYYDLTFQELEQEKQKLIADKSYDVAIEYAKRQIAVATDAESHLTPDILLEMSDLLYAKGDYDKAWRAYAQWAVQYPGANKKVSSSLQKMQPELNAEITKTLTVIKGSGILSESELITCSLSEHAAYRAVDAAYRCTEDHDRDQTQTQATIELADKFLQHKDRFKAHRTTVELIRTACYEKLITSELSICSFYRQQGNHDAAKARLALVEEEYGTKFPAAKTHVIAYRTQHYGEKTETPVEAPATLLTKSSEKGHAADRF